MDALQLKRIAAFLMGSTQPNHVNQKRKNIRVDDNDNVLSDHEDDTNVESFESVDDGISACVQPGPHNISKTHAKLIDHQLHHSMNYLPEGFSKSRTVVGTGARYSLVHLTTSITSTSVFKLGLSNREFHGEWPLAVARFSRLPPMPSRHPRGLTCGLKVQAMVQKDGKLKVPIPQEYHQFDMEGESTNVRKTVATKCGWSLSTHKYRLRKKYMNLKSAKGEEYARSHPPPECDLEKWKNLIDKKWNDTNWLDNMIKIQAEHCSEPGVVPSTPEELSVKVLKPRSGYVRNYSPPPDINNSIKIKNMDLEIRRRESTGLGANTDVETETLVFDVVGMVGAELLDLSGTRSVLSPFRVSIPGYFV
ncbi:hypothetical protein ACSBR2_009552 [Camellia fascicularis]